MKQVKVEKLQVQGNLNVTVSYEVKLVCMQAHWFMYSQYCFPLSIFDDKAFRTMLEAMIPPDCIIKKAPSLNRKNEVHSI